MRFIHKVYRQQVLASAPQWNQQAVERILKSHVPLTDRDMKELYKALDYYEYLNDNLDTDQLDEVTDKLASIMERMEAGGRLPKGKEEYQDIARH